MDWVLTGHKIVRVCIEFCHFCKAPKLDWVAFHSVAFQLNCLDFQSNQDKKLVPVLSRFCNGLLVTISTAVHRLQFHALAVNDIKARQVATGNGASCL